MKRHLPIVRCLMLAVLAMLVLAQTMAFAAVPEVPAATASVPPCHQEEGKARAAQPMSCCDDEDGCLMPDCGVLCHRAGVQFADLPTLPRLAALMPAATISTWLLDLLLVRARIPPLPPPIPA